MDSYIIGIFFYLHQTRNSNHKYQIQIKVYNNHNILFSCSGDLGTEINYNFTTYQWVATLPGEDVTAIVKVCKLI